MNSLLFFSNINEILQQFLAEDKAATEGEGTELSRLKDSLASSTETPQEQFWLTLPRAPSHAAAIFTLPVQMSRLEGN